MSVAGLVIASIDVLRAEALARLWTSIWHLATTRDVVLLQGRQGNWRWPRALGSTVLACVCIVLLLVIIAGIAHSFNVIFKEDKPLDPQQPSSFLLMLFMFLPFILVPSLMMRYLHQVSWRQVLGFSGRFDWHMYLRAAGAFFTTAAILFAIDYPLHPNAYQLLPHGLDHTFWLGLGLAVIFVQTLAEEIMFRGYLLRIWGAVVPFRLLTTAVVMSAFISLHLSNADINTDFWLNLIGFVLTQAVWCYVWFRTQSTAASAGLHWANNVMVFFVVATVPGQSTSMALASFTDPLLLRGGSHMLDPYAWFGMLLGLTLTVVLLVWRHSPFYLPFRRCAVSVTAPPGLLNYADESGKGGTVWRVLKAVVYWAALLLLGFLVYVTVRTLELFALHHLGVIGSREFAANGPAWVLPVITLIAALTGIATVLLIWRRRGSKPARMARNAPDPSARIVALDSVGQPRRIAAALCGQGC